MEALYNDLVNKDLDACETGFAKASINVTDVDKHCHKYGKTVLVLVAEATSGVEHNDRESWSALADQLIEQGVHVVPSLRLAIDKKYDPTVINFLLQKFILFSVSEESSEGWRDEIDVEQLATNNPYAMSLKWLTSERSGLAIEPGQQDAALTTDHVQLEEHSPSSPSPGEQPYSQGGASDCGMGDVIMDALKRSETLREEAISEPRFRAKYKAISEKLEQVAADLVKECNEDENGKNDELAQIMDIEGEGVLICKPDPRNNQQRLNSMTVIKEATIMRMKSFVASPNCQYFLKKVINAPEYETSCLDFVSRKWGTKQSKVFDRALVVLYFIFSAFIYVVTFPFVLIPYGVLCIAKFFSVCSGCLESNSGDTCLQRLIQRLSHKFEHPHYKFINHTVFYAIFLSLLVASAFEEDFADIKTNWGLSALHITIFVFVVGYALDVFTKTILWCRYMIDRHRKKKPRPALQGYWSWYAFLLYTLTTSLFMASYILWICAWRANNDSWNPDDKLFGDSDILYSIACVLAFLRITRILRAHRKLGTLELSLANMLYDVWYFGFLFFFLYISFAVGVRKLYSYHVTATKVDHPMSEFLPTLEGLFWLVIGVLDTKAYNTSLEHIAVQTTGKIMVATYTLLSILVAINMLIALMTKTFERIQTNQETEWAFARTQMWLEYLDYRGTVLPPPLNCLELPRIFYQLYRLCCSCCCESCRLREHLHECCRARCCKGCLREDTEAGKPDHKKTRQNTMRKLIVRYLKKKLNSELRREGDQATELSKLRKDIQLDIRRIIMEEIKPNMGQCAHAAEKEESKEPGQSQTSCSMDQSTHASEKEDSKEPGQSQTSCSMDQSTHASEREESKEPGQRRKSPTFETDDAACVDSEAVESEPSDDCRIKVIV